MVSTKKRSAALLLALLMALGLVATAAPAAVAAQAESASVTALDFPLDKGVVLFRGRAKIGDTWTSDGDKGGTCSGFPSGLNFPGIANDNDDDTEPVVKCYTFNAPGPTHVNPTTASNPFCYAVGIVNHAPVHPDLLSGPPPASNCSIGAEGNLKGLLGDPGDPLGQPRCGVSQSNGGNGTATVDTDSGTKAVALSNLGWVTSAGSVLPVTGNWDSADPAKSKGERKFVALVQASGSTKEETSLALACVLPKGATSFDVNGIAFLTPVFSGDLPAPFNDKCDPLNVLKHPKKGFC